MRKVREKREGRERDYATHIKHHFAIAAGINCVGAIASLIGYFLKGPLGAVIGPVIGYFIAYLLLKAFIRRKFKNARSIWYYFLPTACILWPIDSRKRMLCLERIAVRAERSGPVETKLVVGIADPERRNEALYDFLSKIHSMPSQALARVLDEIRVQASSIVKPDNTSGYNCLLKIICMVSDLDPLGSPSSWDSLLAFLGHIFDPASYYASSVQRDMIEAVEKAILKINDRHLPGVLAIVRSIMDKDITDHDIARRVLKIILDDTCTPQIRQKIFDESKNRAFRFPADFGGDLLWTLHELKHRVFWLDVYSLRDIWISPQNYDNGGIIELNKEIHREMCKKVFSPLENQGYEGKHNGRVFRRLQLNVCVQCFLANGKRCTCEGEDLSLRGVFSRKCPLGSGERIAELQIRPVVAPAYCFMLKAEIAPFHLDETGRITPGRGIIFNDARDLVVRNLYRYIAEPA